MAERTAQVVSSEVKFNGNVSRVFSSVVAANPEAGTKTAVYTRTDSRNPQDNSSRPAKTPKRAS